MKKETEAATYECCEKAMENKHESQAMMCKRDNTVARLCSSNS
eukprot:jgi/Antlo1/110/2293